MDVSDADCEVVRQVCEAVSTRAARLAGAGIVALVEKIGKISSCTVAVDGSLYKDHPKFSQRYIQVRYMYIHVASQLSNLSVSSSSPHPSLFLCRMQDAMNELAPGNGIVMKLSTDGSGRGAAVAAAVASRLKTAVTTE